MKKIYTFFVVLFIVGSLMAQTPQSFKYQAVARDASGDVVADQAVGMQISILQGSTSGTAVYVETFTPTTNEFGLMNLNIGKGTVVSGDLTTIDWSADTYFMKIEMDMTGGTTYEEYGTSQLLSVPYALHAKTAENVTGTVTETDPLFTAWDKSTGISITESQISDLDHFTNTDETDQIFTASVAENITASDTTRWGSTVGTEVDPLFTAWDKSTGISITESQISDLDHFTTADETDPVFSAWDKSTDISIIENQISDFGNYESAFTKNTAFNKNFGNSAGTVTEGDDSRLSDARTPTSHAASHTDGSDDIQDATSSQKGLMTASQATKLEGIEDGAEINVNANWNAPSGDAQILNKPSDLTDLSGHNANELADITGEDITNLGNLSGTNTGDQDLSTLALKSNVIELDNTTAFTPDADYEPSTKKYVDVLEARLNSLSALLFPIVTNPVTGKTWMDRNLGASQVATSSTDADAYGDLYQWGRLTDGHEKRASGTTSTLSSTNCPGHSNFITSPSSPYDWRSPQNDNLWQGVSGTNNPCPSGFRIPTETEWDNERQSWSSNNAAGAYSSPLKLSVGGYRSYSGGSLGNVGSRGSYWSSAVSGTGARYLSFLSSNAYMGSYYRASGCSIRCIKD